MAQNDYKINLGVKVKDNSKNETKKELDKIVKDLQENFKVDLKLKTDALNKQIREYKKEVNSLTKQIEGLKTQLENVSKIKPQSGSFLAGVQKGSHKLTSTNGSKTIDIGLGLTSKNLSKTTISDYGTEKVYEDGIVKAKTFIGATEEAEEKVVSLTVAQKNANKVLEEAVKIQQQLAEAFQKSGMDESAIKSQKEYAELSKIIEKYKTNINTLFERLDKNEKDLRVFDILKNDVVDLQKELTKLSTNAKTKIDEIANSGRSMAEVISKLKESGIDFGSFTFKSESGNITKYADELGRVLTITRKITASGEEDFSYKLSNRFERLSNSVEKTYKDVNKLSDGIINLRRTSEVKEADELKTRIDNLYNSLSALEVKITEATAKRNAQQVNQLTKEYSKQKKILDENVDSYRKLTAQIKNQGGWMLNLKDSWTKAIRSFTTYMSVTTVFYQGVHAIKSMVSEVKNLDDSLTEFKKVSDLAGDSLDRYVKKAYEAGETVAKTGREMIDAATEFKKSGYTDEQSLELGRIALLYSNIADEQLNAGDAANFMIAQMKAFNIQAGDSIKIIDALNEVSNSYAVSSADLANAIGNVSSTMAAGDTTYEQTLGLMTAITEITRNSNKSANALKTIGQRIRGVGEDGEDASEYVASLQENFDKLGINVQIVKNSAGEMESTYNILKGIAEKWNDLTDAERQSLGELAAGKNRITEFNALMSNWQTAVEATATAMNSQGSAAKENERVLDSIEGHLQKLKSAWEELSTTVVDSDLIKMIVDLGTALLNFANSGMGQFIIKAGLAVGAISLLKAGYNALTRSVIKYIAIQNLATKGITDFTIAANATKLTQEINTLSKSGVGLQTIITTIGAKGKSLLGVLGSIVKFIGPAGWIILGLTAVATITKKIYNYTKEETEKKLKRYEDINKQLDEYKKRLEELQDYKYLSDSEKEELQTLKEKIELLEKEKKELKEIYETEKERETLRKTKEAQKALGAGDIVDIETPVHTRGEKEGSNAATRGQIGLPSSGTLPGIGTDGQIPIAIKTTKDLISTYEELDQTIKELQKTGQDTTKLQKQRAEYFEILEEKADKYKEAYDLAIEAKDVETATEAWDKYLNVLKLTSREEYDRLSNLSSIGNTSQETYDKLNSIINEYNKTQKLTADQTKELIDLGMRNAITFDDEGNAASLDTDAMWALYKAKLNQNQIDLDKKISDNLVLLQKEGYGAITDAQAFLELYNQKKKVVNGIELKSQTEAETLEYIKQKKVVDAVKKSIEGMTTSAKRKSKSSSSSSSSKSEKSWWEKQLDILKEQYSDSEITIEEYIKALEALLGKLKKGSDSWKEVNKLLQEQKLSKIESDYKRGVISLDEYIKKLQDLIKTYKQGTKAWKGLADKIKEGLLDKAEQEQKDYEDAAKAATSIIDDEIKRLEELKDAKQKANDETEKELELAKLQEALEKAKNERTKRVFVEGKGWTYVQDEQAIKEAQEALDKFNKEQETDEIDKQIEALEKYKEAWSNVSRDYEKEQQKLLLAQKFGADAEEQILNKRLEILEEYRKKYLETLKQISDIEKKTAEEILGATTGTSTGTGGEAGTSGQEGLVSSIKAVFGKGRKNNKNDVKALQQALMALGYSLPKYGVDGKWGSETLKALKKFQKDNGLKADGIVGKNTKSAFAKKGYANGGVVDYTGYAMVHGSANYPEVMLNNRQATKLYSMLSHPAYDRVGNTSNTTQVYNFDKLVLPNVNNAKQFLSELKSLVNITKNN